MAALTPVLHVAVHLLLVWIPFSEAPEELMLRAKPAEDVTLPCNSSRDAAITKLEWNRTELKHYVFYFSDNRQNENYQDPRYHGRVQLKDPKMKNGNASVLLKNVGIDDTGTYECWVITHSNNRRKRNERELVRSVNLIVSEGSEKHLKNGDANDEQPEGSGGHVVWGASLGLVFSSLVLYL